MACGPGGSGGPGGPWRGLCQRGYRLAKAALAPAQLAALKAELTMVPLNLMMSGAASSSSSSSGANPKTRRRHHDDDDDDGDDSMSAGNGSRSFPIYDETRQAIYVPKYFGLRKFGLPEVNVLEPGSPVHLTFAGDLRPEQLDPCGTFLEASRDPMRMGGIVSLSCGQGKTVIALKILAELKKKALIIVHKDFLLNQWRERIAEFLPGARVGLVKRERVDVQDRDIILASVQSLSMREYPLDIFAGVGVLVVDECHRLGTEVFSRALKKWTFPVTLGLSATVQRKDGMTKAFVAFLGDIVYQGRRRVDAVDVVQTSFISPTGPPRSFASTSTLTSAQQQDPYGQEVLIPGICKPNISRMINGICAHQPRTAFIVDIIRMIFARDRDRKILVLSDRKQQLADLKARLDSLASSQSQHQTITSGFYYGGLKAQELQESEQKQVLLATFAYASEGMDCKSLDTLILASPKSDIEQSCGRILREKAAERRNGPLIVDIVDEFSLFVRQAAKRRVYFRKNKYNVHIQSMITSLAFLDSPSVSDGTKPADDHYGFR